MPIIETKDLCLTYGGGTSVEAHALKNCNMTIEKGEMLGVIGHTGSGKSTLAQLLNGLLKPTSGQILLDGKDIWEKPKEIRKVRFKIGLVFQYPEYQLFEETVYKDIAFGPRNKGLSGDELDRAVREAAEMVGLKEELLDKSPFELSGGEKRRAAIAGVMAMQPSILILDEPTAGLDPRGRERILERIRQYRDKTGSSVMLISHSMEDVAKIADRVLVLHGGEVEMQDITERVFSKGERLQEIGLQVPQITQVFLLLKKRGIEVPTSVYTTDYAFKTAMRLFGREADK